MVEETKTLSTIMSERNASLVNIDSKSEHKESKDKNEYNSSNESIDIEVNQIDSKAFGFKKDESELSDSGTSEEEDIGHKRILIVDDQSYNIDAAIIILNSIIGH